MHSPHERRASWQPWFLLVLLACAGWPLFAGATRAPAGTAAPAREWPMQWDGHPLRPMALSAVEQRFAAGFPGRIAKFSAGGFSLVLRESRAPTRMLHPAVDCFRGLGYHIEQARLEQDRKARLWRCFTARNGARALRVCERIESATGASFTDASAWFWDALLGKSQGPWLAITRVESL